MSHRFEQCKYAVQLRNQGLVIGGFAPEMIMACCKNKEVGKGFLGFLGLGGLDKVTDFADFSADDEDTEHGVAYRLKSIDRCSSCRHFRQPKAAWQEIADNPTERISAIKAYREQHNVGLAEAKKAVEDYIEGGSK